MKAQVFILQTAELGLVSRYSDFHKCSARRSSPLRLPLRTINLIFGFGGDFQDGEEGFLGNVDAADALHAFFPFFLFFEEFAFAADVSAVAFGDDVFANGADGFAGDDAAADGGLERHFEHLARDQLAQARNELAAAVVGLIAMADEGERVDGLAADEHIELDEIGSPIAGEMVIERSVAARNAFEAIVEIENDFIQRHLVGEHDAGGREIFEIFLNAALLLAKGENAADGFIRGDDHGGENGLFDFDDGSGRRKFCGVVDFHHLAGGGGDAIFDAGRGGDEIDIEFALEAFLDDFHVQKAEKAAAKTEAESHGSLRIVEEGRVVELQLCRERRAGARNRWH